MKKLYFALLTIFCIASQAFGQASQQEIMQEMHNQLQNCSREERKRIEYIEELAQTGRHDELTQDDIDFHGAMQKRLLKKAQEALVKAKKIAAEQDKKATKHQVAAFRNKPLGDNPCDKCDEELQNILHNVIEIDEEIAYYNKNHRTLETALACNDVNYKAESIATSPYHSKLALIDGTTLYTMPRHGKLTTNHAPTEPENEFEIEITALDDEQYQIEITGRNICNTPWDYVFQNAHRKLAICMYKNIQEDADVHFEEHSQLQGEVEGTRYPGLFTSCSDAQARIVCSKDLLTYCVKKRHAQHASKKSWAAYAYQPIVYADKMVDAVTEYANSTTPEYQEMQARIARNEARLEAQLAQEQEQFDKDAAWYALQAEKNQSWLMNFFGMNPKNSIKNDDTVTNSRTTDLQQLQQHSTSQAS